MTCVSPVHEAHQVYRVARSRRSRDDEKRETRRGPILLRYALLCGTPSHKVQLYEQVETCTYLHKVWGSLLISKLRTNDRGSERADPLHRKVLPASLTADCDRLATYVVPSGKSKQVPHRRHFEQRRKEKEDDEARRYKMDEGRWFCSFAPPPSMIVQFALRTSIVYTLKIYRDAPHI